MPHPTQMTAADTSVLVIDVQEKLLAKIPTADSLVKNIAFLIDGARLLGLPVQATEQYPKGLGSTVAELAKRLPERPDKVAFSCCAVPGMVEGFRKKGRSRILLAGIGRAVRVSNTAVGLVTAAVRVIHAAGSV